MIDLRLFRSSRQAAERWCYLKHGEAKRGRRPAGDSEERIVPGPDGPVLFGDRMKGLLASAGHDCCPDRRNDDGRARQADVTEARSRRPARHVDDDTAVNRPGLRRGLPGATACRRDARASWQRGGALNADGRLRRWLPETVDRDAVPDTDIQEIAVTLDLTPRKYRGFRSPVEAFRVGLGNDVDRRSDRHVALRA